MEATSKDDESVVGDECHIISAKPGGPRYDSSFPSDQIDSHSNLLLLCKVHHKLVDDQESTYTAELLRQLKDNHEKWVAEQLDSSSKDDHRIRIKRVQNNIPEYLRRVTDGTELLALICDSCAYSFDHDELKTEEEADVVGEFLQNAQDWGEFGVDESGLRVRTGFQLTQSIRELENAGFWLFGGREIQVIEGGKGAQDSWPVAILRVLRKTNREILTVPINSVAETENGQLSGE